MILEQPQNESVESVFERLTAEFRECYSVLTLEHVESELSRLRKNDFFEIELSRLSMRIRFGELAIEDTCSIDVLREMFPAFDLEELIDYSRYRLGLRHDLGFDYSEDFEEPEYWNDEE